MTRDKKPAPAPDDLTREQRIAVLKWIVERPHLRHLAGNRKLIRLHVDECLLHHRMNGNRSKITDWVAACQKWITKHERWKIERVADERPQQLAQRDFGFTPLSDTLKVIEGGKK